MRRSLCIAMPSHLGVLVLTLLCCSKPTISQDALQEHRMRSYATSPYKVVARFGVEANATAAGLLRNGLTETLGFARRIGSLVGGYSVKGVRNGLSMLDIAQRLNETLSFSNNDSCTRHLQQLLQNLNSDYSLQMLDSMGVPSSGILEGNLNWMGDFDECMNSHTDPAATVQFSGQYCKLHITLASSTQGGQSPTLQIGICVPSGCSNGDVTTVVKQVLLLLGYPNSTSFSADCHPLARTLDGKALAAIIVLCVLGGLLIIATFYDVAEMVHGSLRHNSLLLVDPNSPPGLGSSGLEASDDERSSLLKKYPAPDHLVNDSGRRGILWQIVGSISCYQNGRRLLGTMLTDSSLACINGIRFLSISWIVLGHTYLSPVLSGVIGDQVLFFNHTVMSRSFQAIINASVSVDTFFVLSGFLATYMLLKEIKARSGQLATQDWVLMYVHRYVRLTGAYAAILMVWTCLVIYLGDGPGWPSSSFDSCNVNWWTNLLYVNNFIRPKVAPCMDWTWYLANDMQFFLLAPPLAYLLYKNRLVGLTITSLLICGSVASTAAISTIHSYKMSFLAGADGTWFDDDYIKPWCRFVAYGVGIVLGYIIFQFSTGIIINRCFVISGWLVAAGCCLSVVYAPFDAELGARAASASVAENTAYNSLSRLAWATAVAWLIFACCTGYGGWVNTLLSWKAFAPLARLTYCIYLIHPMVLAVTVAASRGYVHIGGAFLVPFFLGTLVISSGLAFVASIAFEAPVMGLERYLRHGRAQRI